ncbi:MAG: hypothetical protein ACJ8DZ_05445 [Allosphingosinicella sp.]
MARLPFAAALLLAGSASAAQAADHATSGPFPVTGNVPALCAGGTLNQDDGVFAVGTLIDTSTGFLLPNLSAPDKVLHGAFCSSRSTITVDATPMTARNATGVPAAGFSRTVNFTATASGWTSVAATFVTGAATHPGAVQTRATGFTGDIVVGIGAFETGGGNTLRLVADPRYEGSVTVTLAIAS